MPAPLTSFEIFRQEGRTLVAFSRQGVDSANSELILRPEALQKKAADFQATRPGDAALMLKAHQVLQAG